MRRKFALLLPVFMVAAGLAVGVQVAVAHQCTYDENTGEEIECHDTPVYDDWRPNYVPLFDLTERDEGNEASEQQRYDAQRWREECADDTEASSMCIWIDIGNSVRPYPSDEGDIPRPNELHLGIGATHCFLFEGAHDCDTHENDEFGAHDSHGGSIYADLCITSNSDSKYCDDGLSDTQAGVTIVDHLTCPMGCMDEYHVVRPADTEYTTEQMEDSVAAAERIQADPKTQICGYEPNACP